MVIIMMIYRDMHRGTILNAQFPNHKFSQIEFQQLFRWYPYSSVTSIQQSDRSYSTINRLINKIIGPLLCFGLIWSSCNKNCKQYAFAQNYNQIKNNYPFLVAIMRIEWIIMDHLDNVYNMDTSCKSEITMTSWRGKIFTLAFQVHFSSYSHFFNNIIEQE